MVFQVFIICNLYFSNVNAKNSCLAAHMLVLNIVLCVLKLIRNVSYIILYMYRLSLSRIDRSRVFCQTVIYCVFQL